MSRHTLGAVCVSALLLLTFITPAPGGDIVLNDPNYPTIGASGLDQPELSALLTDGGTVITDGGEPVMFDAFIDTGASGFVISYLQARGYTSDYILPEQAVPSLGLDGDPSGEFIGIYTETGVGGQEVGDVTRPFGVRVLNGVPGITDPNAMSQFVDYGQYNLWVRQAEGAGEKIWILQDVQELVDPINIVGMPVIGQRVLYVDPTTMLDEDIMRVSTYLLPHGDPALPSTNVTFDVRLQSFVGPPPQGEVLPSSSDNPVVRHISIGHTADNVSYSISDMEWLFDTGSGSTFLSFAKAKAVGLIPDTYATLEDYLTDHIAAGGLALEVGGIGPSTTVPVLALDEIRIQAQEGFDLVWQNVDVLVLDIAGLDGVFGMNLLMPSVTIDPSDPLGWIDDINPGYFDAIVFDAQSGQLGLFTSQVPEPASLLLFICCSVALLRRR